MRTIKYRVYNKVWGMMIDKEIYNLGIDETGIHQVYWINTITDGQQHKEIWENPDDFVVMQFTELKDKNGNEIYEGDIVKYDDTEDMSHWCAGEIALIVFNPARFSGRMKPYDRFTGTNQNMLTDDFEDCTTIIGNIYENPELLN